MIWLQRPFCDVKDSIDICLSGEIIGEIYSGGG